MAKMKVGTVDEQDNHVIELVLKGVNIIMTKCSEVSESLKQVLTDETNLLFKLTHHKIFKI